MFQLAVNMIGTNLIKILKILMKMNLELLFLYFHLVNTV